VVDAAQVSALRYEEIQYDPQSMRICNASQQAAEAGSASWVTTVKS
jgi:hypothetical protein